MKKVLPALAVVAAIVFGCAAVASNMGFKFNYTLLNSADVGSNSGTSVLALPYYRADTINLASELQNSIGFADVANIQAFDKSDDSLTAFTGRKGSPPDFSLVSGEANFVKMINSTQYVIVGSHDPSFARMLLSSVDAGSNSGTNFYSYPYHSTAETAQQLMDDIGFADVANVQQFDRSNDSLTAYTGRKGSPVDFNLVPGEGYFVKMINTVSYTPSHY